MGDAPWQSSTRLLIGVALLFLLSACRREPDGADPSRVLVPGGKYQDICGLVWLPGGKELAFQHSAGIAAYDEESRRTRDVAQRSSTTWPNGSWLSADGRVGILRVREAGRYVLANVDLASGATQTLYAPEQPWDLAWGSVSPDGKWVAFSENNSEVEPIWERLCVLSLSTNGGIRQVWGGQGGYYVGVTRWAANSASLAWEGGDPGDRFITHYVATDAVGAEPMTFRKFASDGEITKWGCWSPVGWEFVYFHLATGSDANLPPSTGPNELRVWKCNTWSHRTITSLPSNVGMDPPTALAAWSADGSRIAYSIPLLSGDTKKGRAELWVVNGDGTGNRRVAACDSDPEKYGADCWSALTWRPDGKALVFVRNDNIMELDIP